MSTTATDQKFPLFRLLVISGAIFVAVSSEFLPTGLLPDIASELKVSESQVGLLVTIFAVTVVVSTAPLAALTHRFPRKWLMVTMLGVFALANVLAALAPNYAFLAGARVLGGLAHGLFWSVTGPYAARIVPRHQLSRAMAVTNGGGTAAFILGVPFGTALGHALGWRLAFAVMGGVVLVFLALVVIFLPHVIHIVPLATGEVPLPLRRDKTVPLMITVCVTILLIAIGQNTFYTYIVPWATQVGGIPPGNVSALLFAYGAAGAVGLVVAGVLGDRYPRGALLGLSAGLAATVSLLGIFGERGPVLVILLMIAWSIAFGGIPSLLQTRMMHSVSQRLRDTAAAWTTISFNVAIGTGALLGAALLDGLGIRALPWAQVVFVVAALVFLIVTDRRRTARHPG
jgi:predicted MFS family arabinose efflux permease